MDLYVPDLESICNAANYDLIFIWLILLFIGLITLILYCVFFLDFVKCKCPQCKTRINFAVANNSQQGLTYQVAVIFDLEDGAWRVWVGKKLKPKLMHWDIEPYVMGLNDGDENGWALENSSRDSSE